MRWVAFDVETPNFRNDRICSMGISIFEEGKLKESRHYLVNPETDFDYGNIRIHGIRPEEVEGEPTFPELWQLTGPVLHSGIVVAHNAVFDLGVLKKLFARYDIREESVPYVCTCRMTRKLLPELPDHKLETLCRAFGIPLDHHNACSDSRACGEILRILTEKGYPLEPHLRTYAFTQDCRGKRNGRW